VLYCSIPRKWNSSKIVVTVQVVQPTSHGERRAAQPHPVWDGSGEAQRPQVSWVQRGVWRRKRRGRRRPGGGFGYYTDTHTHTQLLYSSVAGLSCVTERTPPVLQVFATGYSFSFPFLASHVVSVSENKASLYKYVFPPELDRPTLAVIGLVQPLGAIMPIAEMQARWATRVFKGEQLLFYILPRVPLNHNIDKGPSKPQYVRGSVPLNYNIAYSFVRKGRLLVLIKTQRTCICFPYPPPLPMRNAINSTRSGWSTPYFPATLNHSWSSPPLHNLTVPYLTIALQSLKSKNRLENS